MSERLIIRLASEAAQKQHWLIWSDTEKEIIASGEVDNAEQLNTLTEKALSRQVICLLPGVDVTIKEVAINGVFNRQMQQALPYLIEEDLAGDVEKLHLTVIAKRTDLVHVAICDKHRMVNWLAWLTNAEINCKQFIPEGLALPTPVDNSWQAVQLDNNWIVRENKSLAWSCEASLLTPILASKIEPESHQLIECFSPAAETEHGDWQAVQPTLPMELLAKGALVSNINLLHGEFKLSKESNKMLLKWRLPAIFAAFLFVISYANLYVENRHIAMQTDQVKEQVEEVYQLAFPNQNKLAYPRIKRRITTMLSELDNDSSSADFLLMLNEIAPGFQNNKALMITTLKYDAVKQEMRILALGENFQAFEKLATELPKHYSLQQGALNSSKNKVSGLLTIRKE
ncbi:type II secretion system protein L [Psychromonas marina]|uniref:Type II secretion system protein L n=1 Tax=Psychromonas marina TaxID=88364 RepID=A0ABQ6DZN3_9GAMM|nr:type II secretion system protein GspL [Psychromonas marina]GLS90629.1 type II secretion system protein L [Psychromonas marina]